MCLQRKAAGNQSNSYSNHSVKRKKQHACREKKGVRGGESSPENAAPRKQVPKGMDYL